MNRWRRTLFAGLISLLALASPRHAVAGERGVLRDSILFGQSAALEGPSSALGRGMRHGILAAFNEANAKGGVHGRKLDLVSRDDGYDPDWSVAQTQRLIDQDDVFALIGAVGTPTALATVPIARARGLPFIGPFSGAEFLRTPDFGNVVNIRASYAAEAEAAVQHLTEDLGFSNIAIFYQDDAFGRDGLAGVKRALEKRGMQLSGEATFERNTRAVGGTLRMLKRAQPQAVVMFGTYGPSAEFIKRARTAGFHPTFVNISFVGANALARELGAAGEGVVVSQVVPFPWDTTQGVVAEYQAALHALDPELPPDFVSLEGYLSGRLTAAALELAGPNPTRAGLLQVIDEVGQFDIGGSRIAVGSSAREAPRKVFLTVIQSDGSFRAVDRL